MKYLHNDSATSYLDDGGSTFHVESSYTNTKADQLYPHVVPTPGDGGGDHDSNNRSSEHEHELQPGHLDRLLERAAYLDTTQDRRSLTTAERVERVETQLLGELFESFVLTIDHITDVPDDWEIARWFCDFYPGYTIDLSEHDWSVLKNIQTSPATPESCQIRSKTKFQQIILASKTADVNDLELFYASEPMERCSLTIAEKADTQIDDWELIDASEIPSLPLTGQGRIDFAHLSHEQCDRVDWITAFATVGPYLDQIQLIEKRMKRYMQVLADADFPMMFLKYESFFLTAMDGLAGAKPTLYRQRYVNAFCELKQYLPELKLQIC